MCGAEGLRIISGSDARIFASEAFMLAPYGFSEQCWVEREPREVISDEAMIRALELSVSIKIETEAKNCKGKLPRSNLIW